MTFNQKSWVYIRCQTGLYSDESSRLIALQYIGSPRSNNDWQASRLVAFPSYQNRADQVPSKPLQSQGMAQKISGV